MVNPLSAPIGSEFNVNGADYTLLAELCRFGYMPIQYLPGRRVIIRRNLHKLLTREELLEQLA